MNIRCRYAIIFVIHTNISLRECVKDFRIAHMAPFVFFVAVLLYAGILNFFWREDFEEVMHRFFLVRFSSCDSDTL